jgi:hypothetical protein
MALRTQAAPAHAHMGAGTIRAVYRQRSLPEDSRSLRDSSLCHNSRSVMSDSMPCLPQTRRIGCSPVQTHDTTLHPPCLRSPEMSPRTWWDSTRSPRNRQTRGTEVCASWRLVGTRCIKACDLFAVFGKKEALDPLSNSKPDLHRPTILSWFRLLILCPH